MGHYGESNSIGDATIGFENTTEESTDPGAGPIGESDPGDPNEATEDMVQDWEDAPANYGDLEVGKLDEAIGVLEEADYQANAEEELCEHAVGTRARADRRGSKPSWRQIATLNMWRWDGESRSPKTSEKWFLTEATRGPTLTSSERELFYVRLICPDMLVKFNTHDEELYREIPTFGRIRQIQSKSPGTRETYSTSPAKLKGLL